MSRRIRNARRSRRLQIKQRDRGEETRRVVPRYAARAEDVIADLLDMLARGSSREQDVVIAHLEDAVKNLRLAKSAALKVR